ncbi:MAG: DUF1559 domain-containing protein, partial [Candidatus Omnitrophica bacterium]|nr:DUF1559 domain-containing protein [Candidatus Omnitrophota bacterium]
MNNLKQIGVAIQMYKVDFDTLPKNCWVILPSSAASDGILYYMLKTYIKDRKILKCPTDRRPNAWLSYGENYNMISGGEVGVYGGTDLKGGPDPSGTIYIGDWNGHNLGLYIRCTGHATTQPGDIDFRHNGWANFLMV